MRSLTLAALLAFALTAVPIAAGEGLQTTPDPEHHQRQAQRALRALARSGSRQGVPSYIYKLSRNCFCPPTTDVKIVVRNGRPREVDARRTCSSQATVPRLFRTIQEAIDRKVAKLVVTYGKRGVPRSIFIDSVHAHRRRRDRLPRSRIRPAEALASTASPGTSSSPAGASGASTPPARSRACCRPTAPASGSSTTSTSCSTRRCCRAPRRACSSRATSSCRCASSCRAASTCASAGSPARRPSATPCRSRASRARVEDLSYDQLIVTVGSVSRTLPIPGLAEHGRGFKSLPEAIALRNHVLRTLEHAETLEDGAARREFLTYVFVGAGYAGLEGLAELQDFVADILDLYPRCAVTGVRWILVEAGPRVMQEIPAKLADFAERELRGRGIEIRTNTTLDRVTAHHA